MLEGKGVFVWNLINCKGGDMVAFAEAIKAAGFSWVVIKCADGLVAHNAGLFPAAKDELERRGIAVYGYQYVYGGNLDTGASIAVGEAQRAIAEIDKHGLELLVIDAEGWYERPGAATWAGEYCGTLRAHYSGTVKLALCSFRYPTYHEKFPWSTFLNYVDYHMPQVYWVQANNPGYQLVKSYNELMSLEDLPFIPVGAAYKESYKDTNGNWVSWQPTVAEINEFDAQAHAYELPGECWWAWDDHGIEEHPDWLAAITAHQWGVPEPPPDPLAELKERVDILEKEVDVWVNASIIIAEKFEAHLNPPAPTPGGTSPDDPSAGVP